MRRRGKPASRRTQFALLFDNLNGNLTVHLYNAFGDVTCQALNGMQRTKYTYDNYGRQTRQQFPDGGTIKTVYSQSGLVLDTVNQRGCVTSNTHDLAGCAGPPTFVVPSAHILGGGDTGPV